MVQVSTVFKILVVFLFGCLSLFFFVENFSKAFPIININITEDRTLINSLAKELLEKYGLCPFKADTSSAMLFYSDSNAQKFIEWTTNQTYFDYLIRSEIYEFYQWHVRFFEEGEECETWIFLSSDLKPIGFSNLLPESYNFEGFKEKKSIKNLNKEESSEIFDIIVNDFFPLENYEYLIHSEEEKPSGRVTHLFRYEKVLGKVKRLQLSKKGNLTKDDFNGEVDPEPLEDDEIKLMLNVEISGNRVSGVHRYLRIPEDFSVFYEISRGMNDSLALVANVLFLTVSGIFLVYGFITTIRRYFILNHHILKSILIGSFFSFILNIVLNFNSLPKVWIGYNTNIPKVVFISQYVSSSVVKFLFSSVTFSLIIMATEALNRLSFIKHIRFYRIFHNLGTWEVFEGVVLAYFLTFVMLAYVCGFYRIFREKFDWWLPTTPHLDPKYFSDHVPWVTAVVNSLLAGFLEELIFRSLIMSSVYQIGYKKNFLGVFIKSLGFSFQIFVFSAAHAFYPSDPFYSRFVELVVPSVMFGVVYLRWGFYVSFLFHYLFDMFWYCLLIFRSNSPNIWVHRAILTFFFLLPLLLVGVGFMINGFKLVKKGKYETNKGYLKERNEFSKKSKKKVEDYGKNFARSGNPRIPFLAMVLFLPLICYCLWKLKLEKIKTIPSHFSTDRNYAFGLSKFAFHQKFKSREIPSDEYFCFSDAVSSLGGIDHQYVLLAPGVLSNTTEEYEHLLKDEFLRDTYYKIKCFKFGVVEVFTFVFYDGTIKKVEHLYNEDAELNRISEEDIEEVALKKLKEHAKMTHDKTSYENLSLVSKISIPLPKRVDWVLIYNVTNVVQVEIKISGDQLSYVRKKIFVPDTFIRSRETRESIIGVFLTFFNMIPLFMYLFAVIVGIKLWTRSQIDAYSFFYTCVIMSLLTIARTLFSLPAVVSQYIPQKLLITQVFSSLLVVALSTFFGTFLVGVISSYTVFWKRKLDFNRKGIVLLIICGATVCVIREIFSVGVIMQFLAGLVSSADYTPISSIGYEMMHDLNSYSPLVSITLRICYVFVWSTGIEWFFVMWVQDFQPFLGSLVVAIFGSVTLLNGIEINPVPYLFLFWGIGVLGRSLVLFGIYHLFEKNCLKIVKYRVFFMCVVDIVVMIRENVFPFPLIHYGYVFVFLCLVFLMHSYFVDREESSVEKNEDGGDEKEKTE